MINKTTRGGLRLLGLLAAIAAASPAWASTQAAATVSDIQFTLSDLTPSDGVMPGYVLGQGYSYAELGVSTKTDNAGYQQSNPAWLSLTQANGAVGTAEGGSEVWSGGLQSFGSAQVKLDDVIGRTHSNTYVWVAPGSALTISADYSLFGNPDPLCSAGAGCALWESAATIEWFGVGQAYDIHGVGIGGDLRQGDPAGAQSSSGQLSVTFTNTSDRWQRGWVQFDADIQSSVMPVPEPGTVALMGVGLLGVAGATRRRRRARC